MGNPGDFIQMKYVVASLLYSGIGVLVFIVSYVIIDSLTPKVSIYKELVEKQNIAVAIFLGAIALGIATIIASAIHG
jgi:putative membrane protein